MLAHRRPQAKKNNQPMTYEALLAEVKRKEELEKENAKPKKAVSAATKPQDIEPLTSLETKPKTDEEKKKLFNELLDHFQVQHDSSFNDFVIYMAKDIRYKQVRKMNDKLQRFREYKAKLKSEKENSELTDGKKSFKVLLQSCKSMLIGVDTIEGAAAVLGEKAEWKVLESYPDSRKEMLETAFEELAKEVQATKDMMGRAHKESFERLVRQKVHSNDVKVEWVWEDARIQNVFKSHAACVFFGDGPECKEIFEKHFKVKREVKLKEVQMKKKLEEVKKEEEEKKQLELKNQDENKERIAKIALDLQKMRDQIKKNKEKQVEKKKETEEKDARTESETTKSDEKEDAEENSKEKKGKKEEEPVDASSFASDDIWTANKKNKEKDKSKSKSRSRSRKRDRRKKKRSRSRSPSESESESRSRSKSKSRGCSKKSKHKKSRRRDRDRDRDRDRSRKEKEKEKEKKRKSSKKSSKKRKRHKRSPSPSSASDSDSDSRSD